MYVSRHYSKSPLTEAVIDIRVNPSESLTPDIFSQAFLDIKEQYPKRDNLLANQLQVLFKAAMTTTVSQSQAGYQFTSHDGHQIFQARMDGFSFNRLAPYERWETFRDEAQKLWQIYREIIKPEQIIRVAVRYISRLDLPIPLTDFREYLNTVPEVAPNLPQGLTQYALQLHIPYEDLKTTVILNQVMLPYNNPASKFISIILDIDAYRVVDLPQDEKELWLFLEQLRILKNDVFESSITDKFRELIS